MIFQLTDEVTIVLAEHLRQWFAEHALAQEYRWNSNANLSKIGIYEQYPDEPRFYPSIIIKGLVGGFELSGFNDNAGALIVDNEVVGEQYGGWYNPRVEFLIESTHDADVRRIADLLGVAVVRTLQQSVPRDTNNRIMWQTPELLRPTSRGMRNDTNNRAISFIGMQSSFKVMWFDQRELPDTFLTARTDVTILDC